MKWQEIHKIYPNKFILLSNIVEEKISEFKSKIIKGTVIGVGAGLNPQVFAAELN